MKSTRGLAKGLDTIYKTQMFSNFYLLFGRKAVIFVTTKNLNFPIY